MTMKKYTGFTLLELLVMLAVVSIIISVGLPQMSIFFKGNRMVTNTNDLIAGLHIARSEAIKRNRRVSICKSSNADEAAPECAAGAGGWEDGWFVFEEDANAGNVVGTYDSATDGAILRVNAGAEGSNVTITTDDANIQDFVSFTSRGAPKLSNGSSQSGVFRVCDDRGLENAAGGVVARGVLLGASGRVRTTKDAARIGECP